MEVDEGKDSAKVQHVFNVPSHWIALKDLGTITFTFLCSLKLIRAFDYDTASD